MIRQTERETRGAPKLALSQSLPSTPPFCSAVERIGTNNLATTTHTVTHTPPAAPSLLRLRYAHNIMESPLPLQPNLDPPPPRASSL